MTTKTKKIPLQTINNKQTRYLRGLGHHLSPLAMVGKEGVTVNVIKAVQDVLRTYELIKMKIQNGSPTDRHETAAALSAATGAAVVQVLGNTILLYRANRDLPEDKAIKLP